MEGIQNTFFARACINCVEAMDRTASYIVPLLIGVPTQQRVMYKDKIIARNGSLVAINRFYSNGMIIRIVVDLGSKRILKQQRIK
jgi:hypothetical protein